MNRLISTLAALFFCTICNAQQYFDTWARPDSSEYYVFADIAYVRADTSTISPILDSLQPGENILVLQTMPAELTLKGITAPWVKLSYQKEGVRKQGFMWSPLLSFSPLRRGDTKFIYGIDRRTSKDTISEGYKYTMYSDHVELKVVQNNSVVARVSFRVPLGEGSGLVMSEIHNGKQLQNVLYIPSITLGGGACGVGANTYMHTWNGKELYALPVLYEVGDAGVYYYTEQFIFPADKGGKPGMVAWESEEAEATEKLNKKGDPIFKVTKKKKIYTWDGVKLSHL